MSRNEVDGVTQLAAKDINNLKIVYHIIYRERERGGGVVFKNSFFSTRSHTFCHLSHEKFWLYNNF